MTTDWIRLEPWGNFPHQIEQRCDAIAQHITDAAWPRVTKHHGSYSFEGLVEGNRKTIAKLAPQWEYSTAIILAAFSPSVPGAEDFARRFDWRETGTIMDKTFRLGRVPDEWATERAAEIIGEFLRQVPPAGREPISL